MKTTLKKQGISLFLLSVLLISYSCKKEEKPSGASTSYSEENFFSNFIQNIGFTETSIYSNEFDYEFGIQFTPLVNGKINSLKVKLPVTNNALRVTLWDVSGQSVIATYIVNVSTANSEITHAITPLTLQSNKSYMITMNENDYYYHTNMLFENASYPVTIGNIRIDNYGFISGTAQQFPDTFTSAYISGDLSFNFQRI